MGILNIFKEIISMRNEDTMRVGLSSFKTSTKKIEKSIKTNWNKKRKSTIS